MIMNGLFSGWSNLISLIFLNKLRNFIVWIDIIVSIDITTVYIDIFIWYNNFGFRFDLIDSFKSGVISGWEHRDI